MGAEHTGSAIRVRKPKPIKDLNLAGCHFRRFGCAFVIEAAQVQYPVDRHVRPVRLQRLTLGLRLEGDDRRADHQFAQEISAVGSIPGARK
jgi:hypothetical protein